MHLAAVESKTEEKLTKYKSALDFLKKPNETDTDEIKRLYFLATCFYKLGDLDQAMMVLLESIEKCKSTLEEIPTYRLGQTTNYLNATYILKDIIHYLKRKENFNLPLSEIRLVDLMSGFKMFDDRRDIFCYLNGMNSQWKNADIQVKKKGRLLKNSCFIMTHVRNAFSKTAPHLMLATDDEAAAVESNLDQPGFRF